MVFPTRRHESATGAPVLPTLSPPASYPPQPPGFSRALALGAPLHASSLPWSSVLCYGQVLFIYDHDEEDERLYGQLLGWSGNSVSGFQLNQRAMKRWNDDTLIRDKSLTLPQGGLVRAFSSELLQNPTLSQTSRDVVKQLFLNWSIIGL